MEPRGIEPVSPACKAGILPLNYGPVCVTVWALVGNRTRISRATIDYSAIELRTPVLPAAGLEPTPEIGAAFKAAASTISPSGLNDVPRERLELSKL